MNKTIEENFNHMVQKNELYLINQIDKIKVFNKLSGNNTTILVFVTTKKKNFTLKELDHLKKIIKISLDNNNFPKWKYKDSILFKIHDLN